MEILDNHLEVLICWVILIWRTDDYGENWVGMGFGGCGANSLLSISFINKQEGWFAGEPSATQEVTIVHTTDGGQTYEIQTNPTDPDIRLNCVSFTDNQHGIAAGVGTTILYTSDGGINRESSPVSNYRWQSVHLNQSGKAWAVGRNGTIAYSTGWGYTWTTQESGVASELREVIFINDNEGWIVGGGTGFPGVILHTTTGGAVTDVNDEINTVREFELHQNYPNPFNPTTKIKYQIPELSFVTLKVFDVLGNEVATLVNHEKGAGDYEIYFRAEDLGSGVYLYELKANSFVKTKKMLIIK